MVSKAEDYASKLHSKIEDDKEILRANKGIFKSWQKVKRAVRMLKHAKY